MPCTQQVDSEVALPGVCPGYRDVYSLVHNGYQSMHPTYCVCFIDHIYVQLTAMMFGTMTPVLANAFVSTNQLSF